MIRMHKGFTGTASMLFLLALAAVVAGVIYYAGTLEDPIISMPSIIQTPKDKEVEVKVCKEDSDCDDDEACTLDTCDVETLTCVYEAVDTEECKEKIEEDDDDNDEDSSGSNRETSIGGDDDDNNYNDSDDDADDSDDAADDSDDACPSDNNPCTDDIIVDGVCKHLANTASCNDGNICTNGDTCDEGVCKGHEKCGEGTYCDADTGNCESVASCTPDCTDKTCGDNGCGGSCGTCGADEVCTSGNCIATLLCSPECTGKTCGDDGCGGSCGTCEAGKVCVSAGNCLDLGGTLEDELTIPDGLILEEIPALCTPNCDGKTCGDDGCGGSCGVCTLGKLCTSGTCQFAILEPIQVIDPIVPLDPIIPLDPIVPIPGL